MSDDNRSSRPIGSATPRTVCIVLDSVGVGAADDWREFDDPPGANTLANIARFRGGLELPALGRLGLGNLLPLEGVPAVDRPEASFGAMAPLAPGKDTSTGHWELTGLINEHPLVLYPDGFPAEIVEPFTRRTGRGIIGNKAASGTEIIEELGQAQAESGEFILYTSADSVFQLAAHEDVIPLEELYQACEIAREILDEFRVGRVIARPFVGGPGAYQRTYNRRDYSLEPPGRTILEDLRESGAEVVGVGKIWDIFAGVGISKAVKSKGNADGMRKTTELVAAGGSGLIFTNLVDFDAMYGHRRNPEGYAAALEEFDRQLPALLSELVPGDLLMLTADHGCDPTVAGSDHTRELVPIIARLEGGEGHVDLGRRSTFADVAATIADHHGISSPPVGTSFLAALRGGEPA